jgi:hypothetical protein
MSLVERVAHEQGAVAADTTSADKACILVPTNCWGKAFMLYATHTPLLAAAVASLAYMSFGKLPCK